ncbi:HET-domain-containing protein [Rostrohypoxylon terebratum]|nr:HET-domain-containing protein [Rostrohypoxylon terebratum]
MRLLNAQTKELRRFEEDKREPYAILSHTWGSEEITLQELVLITEHENESPPHPSTFKTGYRKIQGCCDRAKENGLEWVWVDTCCIDKTDNVELSEAINSMYRWYKESRVCYVYLEDVSSDDIDPSANNSPFRNSRWFTRGWTLQELIAPNNVEFFSNSWSLLSSRSEAKTVLEEITGIPISLLSECGVRYFSIAQHMCWAAKRETTRKEDMAYCLLGIFDINMPLLYGEGDKSFQRLQYEIIRQSTDQTIFAWGLGNSRENIEVDDGNKTISILAESPSEFIGCEDLVPCGHASKAFQITPHGIRVKVQLTFDQNAILDCYHLRDIQSPVYIPLDIDGESLAMNVLNPKHAGVLVARTKRRPTVLISKYLPSRRTTMILKIAQIHTARNVIYRYHIGSVSLLNSNNEACQSLHTDQHLKVVHSQSLSVVHLTSSSTHSSNYRAFLLSTTVAGRICVKIEFYPTRNWKGCRVHKYRCLLAIPAAWPSVPLTREELERLDWRTCLKLNNYMVSIVSPISKSLITWDLYSGVVILKTVEATA